MVRWIVSSSLKFRLLVVALAAATLVVGASQLRKMPVEVVPDFTPTTVEVQTEALGLSATEVEQLITVPIEQDLLSGVAFVRDIRSESVPGLSRILMVFEPGTSVYTARQVVAERLTQAHALPQVSKPPRMLQPLSSTDRVMLVGMSSRSVSALRMGVLARWTIVPRLVGVPGVANVSVWGQRDRELQVQVDPERLRDRGVGLDQVIETSANALWVSPLTFVEASTPGTGGFIDTPNQRLGIQHESPITTAADLAKVRVEGTPGRTLLLGDVANVVEDHQPLIGDASVENRPGLLLVIQRFPGTNLREVTRGVEQAIADMKPGLAGIDFDTGVYRPASYVDSARGNVGRALVVGGALLALVLGAFLLRIRTAAIAVAAAALSTIAALLVLWAFGETLNAIVVAGLAAALVLVIDDAISSLVQAERALEAARATDGADPVARTVLRATLETRRPLLYATLVAALATLPVFFLERLAGAFLPTMAAAYLVAVLASLAVALTVTPALSLLLLPWRAGSRTGSPAARLERGYERGLSRVVGRPAVAYATAGALLVAAAASAPFLGQKLLPAFKERTLLVNWEAPPGTSLPEMNRIAALAGRELRAVPGVRAVGTHVGRAITGDQIVDVNAAEMWVTLDPGADYGSTVAAVKRVVAGYPGLSHDVRTYSEERVREATATTRDDVVVRVYGEDLHVLARQAERVRQAVAGVDGIARARVRLPAQEPTIQVRVDLAKADRYGIKPGDVRRAATTLLSGLVVGNLFEQQKVFDVVVWGTPRTRNSLTSVRRLLIATPTGGHVRLGDVADVRVVPEPGIIRRQAVSRYVDVGAQVSGRDRDAVVRDVDRQLLGLQFPIEYHAEVLAADAQPTWLLVAVAIAAVVGTYLLLQALFGSWRTGALAMVLLPVGAVGGLLGARAAGGDLSLASYAALLGVFGLSARGVMLFVARARELRQQEDEASEESVVLRAARERFTPVALTALATAAVFVPVLVLGSRPGLELLAPVAAVVVGGLATSSLFSLVALPVLHLRLGLGRVAAAAEADDLTAALDELARGAAGVGAVDGVAGGVAVVETRAVPNPEGE